MIEDVEMKTSSASDAKRVGVIVPILSDNDIAYEIIDDSSICRFLVEHDMPGAEYISLNIPYDPDVSEGYFTYYERMSNENTLSAAAYEISKKKCNSIAYACTSGSFFRGLEYAQHQVDVLSKSAAVPATNTSMAFLAALDVLGAKKVDVVLPYAPEIGRWFASFLSEVGVSVGTLWHMKPTESGSFFEMDCEAELAEFVASRPSSNDPILIPCTELSSLRRMELFERVSGRPVLAANQVTVWHALTLAGVTPNISDSGSFFRSYAQAADETSTLPLRSTVRD
ncbi:MULTISPECIES: aspartate/glutamate racemase family protein [unclassified Mesorhizobium]|uniref:maleate cis-trans isomerase family protein n=1 Tax=unclassified Mesorhizobium TaxID=325217 RepID=UPI0018DE6035|nr:MULTISPECIES: aspartate/glutamate racemase family protein [unclassified Mesorhizobium]WJI80969.1 aspartate/glutamate racemase family protein [Mesorhizobium sp. C374B]WJI87508.1 aspartate/glutamate racemase family protein [Mesorhizobium sp. C372A]